MYILQFSYSGRKLSVFGDAISMNLSHTIPNKIDKVVYIIICSNTNAYILFEIARANLADAQQEIQNVDDNLHLLKFIYISLHFVFFEIHLVSACGIFITNLIKLEFSIVFIKRCYFCTVGINHASKLSEFYLQILYTISKTVVEKQIMTLFN